MQIEDEIKERYSNPLENLQQFYPLSLRNNPNNSIHNKPEEEGRKRVALIKTSRSLNPPSWPTINEGRISY